MKTVCLINDWRREMSPDLTILHRKLKQRKPDCTFQVYSTELSSAGLLAREGIGKEEVRWIDPNAILISAEGMAGISEYKKKQGIRILVASASPQLFNAYLALRNKRPTNIAHFYNGFTHVIPGSPFVSELLKRTCRGSHAKYLEGICTPLAEAMSDPAFREESIREIADLYPQVKGKQIIALIGSGKENVKKSKWLNEVSLKKIIERLEPNQVLVTNLSQLLPSLHDLPMSFRDRFAYLYRYHKPYRTAAIADILVTNDGLLASAFAALEKPFWCMAYGNTGFEQFTQKFYPAYYLKDAGTLEDRVLTAQESVPNAFASYLSYPAGKSPVTSIEQIMDRA